MALTFNEGVLARLDVAGLEELKGSWELAMAERRQMVETLEMLSMRYEEQVEEIEALKKSGVDGLNRRKLERKLREARELAEQLEALQRSIGERDRQMANISGQIVDLLDGERLGLEDKLARGEGGQELITTLNELSVERERYAQPLPRIDRRSYASMLEDSTQARDPDDMLAMADELLDAEGQIQQQLQELDGRIDTLKTRQKLLQRADSFWREERFFEEGDRGRTVGSRTRVVTGNSGSSSQGEDDDQSVSEGSRQDQPNVSEGGLETDSAAPEADPDVPQAGAGDEGVAFEQDDSVDRGSDPVTDGFDSANGAGQGVSDPGLTDNPGSVDVASGGQGVTNDPFGTPTDVVVMNRQADPNVSTGSADVSDTQIHGRIRSLEAEKKHLEAKARELRKRANKLKKEAKKLD